MSMNEKDASLIGFGQANSVSALAGNRIVTDSQAALPDETWLVDSCSMFGIDPNNATSFPNTVVSGLFLCPGGTPQGGLSDGLAGALEDQGLIQLPTDGAGALWAGAQAGVTFISTHTTKEFIVPPNCKIRAVWDGGAGPLPTAGASLQLMFTYVRRKVCK